MPRRVFVSYQHEDQLAATGLSLSRHNKHLDLRFFGRHLLDPVDSNDHTFIRRKIREQIRNSSVTILILGDDTADTEWVAHEVQWSLEERRPSGLLGIRLSPDAEVPEGFNDCGAEILEWYKPEDVQEFQGAIERAAAASRRARRMPVNSRTACARTPPPQKATSGRLADILAEETWAACIHQAHSVSCQLLAEIARELLGFKAKTHDALGELAERFLERFERSTIEREVACALVKKIPLPTDAVLVEAARALRVIGIYVCVQLGRDLSRCPCLNDLAHDLLKDLADDLALQELESIIRNALIRAGPRLTRGELEEMIRNALIEIRPQ